MSLEIEFVSLTGVLRHGLDTKGNETLHYIILHVLHPTTGFSTNKKTEEQ